MQANWRMRATEPISPRAEGHLFAGNDQVFN